MYDCLGDILLDKIHIGGYIALTGVFHIAAVSSGKIETRETLNAEGLDFAGRLTLLKHTDLDSLSVDYSLSCSYELLEVGLDLFTMRAAIHIVHCEGRARGIRETVHRGHTIHR